MIYFIPWVVFLLVVILSVPIAGWLEKRKLRAAYGDQVGDEDLGQFDEEEDGEFRDVEEEVADAEEGEAVFEAADDFGGGEDEVFESL